MLAADVSRGWPSLPIGTDIDILDYAGEGQFGIWAAGRQWDAGSFWGRDPSPRQPARLLQAPQKTWWIQVEAVGGQRGWLGLQNTVEDGMGTVFDEALRMSVESGAVDDADCTELLKNRGLE